jgi:hypothetical protein
VPRRLGRECLSASEPSASGCDPSSCHFSPVTGEGVEVVTWQDDPGEFECCALPFSLPTLFGVEHQQDVSSPPYLRALRPFRPLDGAFRVGLRWAGDRRHTDDLQRSTSLADWAPVLAVPGVTFYSRSSRRRATSCESAACRSMTWPPS